MLIYRDLTEWAKHGVLLLNTSLTVRAHEVSHVPYLPSIHKNHLHSAIYEPTGSEAYRQAGSHAGKGWESFTAAILKTITSRHTTSGSGETTPEKGVVLMAWGKHAQNMVTGVDKVCLIHISINLLYSRSMPSIAKEKEEGS
jgi:uracil-DNA glycosylase